MGYSNSKEHTQEELVMDSILHTLYFTQKLKGKNQEC